MSLHDAVLEVRMKPVSAATSYGALRLLLLNRFFSLSRSMGSQASASKRDQGRHRGARIVGDLKSAAPEIGLSDALSRAVASRRIPLVTGRSISDTDSIDATTARRSHPKEPAMITSRTVTFATFTAAAAGFLVGGALAMTSRTEQSSATGSAVAVVHQLPRVVVTGQLQRVAVAQIVELPRVVVTGRRIDSASTLVTRNEAARAALRS
ncbi:MAG: hypothetical protein ABI564_09775 [Ideonella sp.]